jgi:hypothetical protein
MTKDSLFPEQEGVTVESKRTAPANVDRDDIMLVRLFLSQYKDAEGNSYHIAERPDAVERTAKAIEAVAVDMHGHRLAIEHTLVETFTGKKADDIPFITVFEQLQQDKSLLLPERLIDVQCPALAIPKGIHWKDVGLKVANWFREVRQNLPADGQSSHTIPDVGFELQVFVETMSIPGTDGVLVVSRILPDDRPFSDVLKRALTNKLPKLVGTPADKYILLLEDEGASLGFHKVIDGIDSSAEGLPELRRVDAIWVAKTLSWKKSGVVFFCHVWPGGVRERFRVQA